MASPLTIVMAQLNLIVGDIPGNTQTILHAAREAVRDHHADVVVYPELSLTAYPAEDLLLRPSLAPRINTALQQLCDARMDAYLIVGYPLTDNGQLFNAVSVIHEGEIKATYCKQSLPNYQVFDERRYFQSGNSPCIVNIKGLPVALTICEDLWDPLPIRQASQAGVGLLININASPFHTDKLEQRQRLLARRAMESGTPILYVNQVGGQDELVFDGNSMVADADGRVTTVGPAFREALIPVSFRIEQALAWPELSDTASVSVTPDSLPTVPADRDVEQRCYQAMILGLRDYARKNRFSSVILGLSGGIDSALTLALAVDALGADQVTAIMMPFTYTSDLSVRLAAAQAERLHVNYDVIPITDCYQAFAGALANQFAGLPADLTEQNIQARCRGVMLMAISNKKGALVLTTGNKSEIAVGYSTLYGDMAGGFNVLKDASKTLVYRLARYRNAIARADGEADIIPVEVIERPPSAELAPGQQDDDNLPPYDRLDQILALYVESDLGADAIIGHGFDEEEVRRVLRLVDINEYKRRQAPIGVRLTERAFGRDRRYPITQGWAAGE
ncbi:NAD+ synthase [Pseudohongiella acticola]|uniref:Glutamine-dependent NAD(+) synthetase n=1 Tax=Pseudohongiella acticola TaxID=1524254 RepID=A0A1E8CGC8_9GAMM|nr:NAD+ synthase [Pseudohongiella acticola]OFE11277.1 NAD+ synthase [Pseudohongiella acticola]